MTWDELNALCRSCTRCGLSATRKNAVIGRGNMNAPVLFVGEGPGAQEDEQGLPFVGQAGKLLDTALEALDFRPDMYYIANVVKCRPPQNRNPLPDEAGACIPFLREQFRLIRPKIVVCLGSVASVNLIGPDAKITAVRGKWLERKGTYFTATYHPAALLRDESKKIFMWRDLKAVREKIDEIAE